MFTYDLMDGLTRVDYPDGNYVSYSYDNACRLTKVTTPFGSTAYEYDLLDRLTRVVDRNGYATVYEYDANGNRTVEYSYDSLYRLTSETITEGEKVTGYTYAYDNVSNRILKTVNGEETVYTYNALNQLVSENDIVYEYDLNGNTVRMTSPSKSALYEYNAENKLVRATVQNGVLVTEETYTYDYSGNRTSKTTHRSDGVTEYVKYLNDNSSLTNVLAEIDENGTAKCVYTIGADLISQERDGKVSVYLYDGHGSVVGLANESGIVTDTYCYDAFGNLLKSTGSTKNCYHYCGEQFDETTGLYYLRARYMDTSTGRFISQDSYAGSISDPISLHKYLYANANPVMYSDPSGFLVAALPSPGEVMHMKSTVIIGRELLKALCTVGAAYVVSRISSELLATTALQVPNIAEYYRNVLVENAIGEIASNIKSLVLLRNIQIIYASLLHQVMTWASTKGKTNNDYKIDLQYKCNTRKNKNLRLVSNFSTKIPIRKFPYRDTDLICPKCFSTLFFFIHKLVGISDKLIKARLFTVLGYVDSNACRYFIRLSRAFVYAVKLFI